MRRWLQFLFLLLAASAHAYAPAREGFLPDAHQLASNPAPIIVTCTYDPQVEFLIVGIAISQGTLSRTETLAYRPDASGSYGGMHGIGGLESITGPLSATAIVINDAFGNVIGAVTNSTVAWNAARVNLYGPVEGYQPPRLSLGAPTYASLAWRTRPLNVAGLVQLGVRPYEPFRRAFLAADPLGHASDAALNTAFYGNPAAFFDPDGRLGKGWMEGWKENQSTPANSSWAFDLGNAIGNLQSGYYEGLSGGSSITANTLSFGGSDAIGLTDSSQYQGGAYTGSRILSTVGRESLIAAATLGSFQLARAGGEGALYTYQGLQVANAGRSGFAIGSGINQVSEDNNWGYLQIAGGTLGLAGGFTMAAIAPELNALGGITRSGGGPVLVDPAALLLPPTRMDGADPFKLANQIRTYGSSVQGMPPIQVTQGAGGQLMINDGVTRATRVALMSPGTQVPIQVIELNPAMNLGNLPTVGGSLR